MTQRSRFVCGVVLGVLLAACNKPSEGDCKRAIANIRNLLGTDRMSTDSGESAAWVRSCVGNAKKESVKCAMEASTVEQLQRCGLVKEKDLELFAPPPAPPAPPPPAPTPPAAPETPPPAPETPPAAAPDAAPAAAPTPP